MNKTPPMIWLDITSEDEAGFIIGRADSSYLNVDRLYYSEQQYLDAKAAGYRKAISDMKEQLDNALANGYLVHRYEELLNQLIVLEDELEYESSHRAV